MSFVNKGMRAVIGAAALAALAVLSSVAVAAVAAGAADREWTVGAVLYHEDNSFVGQKVQTQLLPYVEMQWGRLGLSFKGLEYIVYDSAYDREQTQTAEAAAEASGPPRGYAVALIATPGLMSREENDAEIFSGMDDRDAGVELGVALQARTALGHWELQLRQAVTAAEGLVLEGSYSVPVYGSPSLFALATVGVEVLDSETADYYYGVRSHEANAERAAHEINEAAVNPFIGLQLFKPLGAHWRLIFEAEHTRLDSPQVDSSLTTDRQGVSTATIGLMYAF